MMCPSVSWTCWLGSSVDQFRCICIYRRIQRSQAGIIPLVLLGASRGRAPSADLGDHPRGPVAELLVDVRALAEFRAFLQVAKQRLLLAAALHQPVQDRDE